jgi:hypothetical protein
MADCCYQRRGGKLERHNRGMKVPTREVSPIWGVVAFSP